MEKIKWSEKVTNEQVLQRTGEKRTLLNNILRIKVNWICHILTINCLLRCIEGQMTEVKYVRRRRRRTQLLDDLRKWTKDKNTEIFNLQIKFEPEPGLEPRTSRYLAWRSKMSLLTSKLNIELEKKLVRCYVWIIALYGSET